jgi:hypothetical protein
MGEVYSNLRQTQKALEMLDRALAIFKEVGDSEGIRTTNIQIEALRQKS